MVVTVDWIWRILVKHGRLHGWCRTCKAKVKMILTKGQIHCLNMGDTSSISRTLSYISLDICCMAI
jgi:hypothetical protein